MLCPADKTEMRQVKIISNYGLPIVLDQCGRCGGIWFDEAELFRAKQGEAEKIEPVNTDILRSPSIIENPKLICPRDQTVLYQFTDKYFPKDIILERCPTCKGIWLNRGQFAEYQKFRQQIQLPDEKSPEYKKLEERIKHLLEAYHSGSSNETLKNLGEFLNSPVSSEEDEFGYPANVIMMVLGSLVPFPFPFPFPFK
jgi:Zn-finger nucleic acid-binding protein